MKPVDRSNQPNIQNLFPKTEDFKRIMQALRNSGNKNKGKQYE